MAARTSPQQTRLTAISSDKVTVRQIYSNGFNPGCCFVYCPPVKLEEAHACINPCLSTIFIRTALNKIHLPNLVASRHNHINGKTRELAMFTVGRAVFFGSLAVSLIMLSFLFDMVLFFRSGAIMAFGMSAILLWYAQTASRRQSKRTETWLLLDNDLRPRNEHAVRAFSQLMEEVHAHYAKHVLGVCLLILSLACQLLGIHSVFERIA